MRAFLRSMRILGVAGASFLLYAVLATFFTVYLPLLEVPSEKYSSLIWRSTASDIAPTVALCLLLLVPFSRISSPRFWRWAFGLLCGFAIVFTVRNGVGAFQSTDTLLSFCVLAIPVCIVISQLSVILIERLRQNGSL